MLCAVNHHLTEVVALNRLSFLKPPGNLPFSDLFKQRGGHVKSWYIHMTRLAPILISVGISRLP